jgi:hypothetical protein
MLSYSLFVFIYCHNINFARQYRVLYCVHLPSDSVSAFEAWCLSAAVPLPFPSWFLCSISHVLLACASFACYCFVLLYFNDYITTVRIIEHQFYDI